MIITPWQEASAFNLIFLRSSLFSVQQKKEQSHINSRSIRSEESEHFSYLGASLSQYEQDIFYALRYLALHPYTAVRWRGVSLPQQSLFGEHQTVCCALITHLFTVLGKSDYGRTDYHLICDSIKRLDTAHCCIRYHSSYFCGRLFSRIDLTRGNKQVTAVFNPEYIAFFNKTPSVKINIKQRLNLPRGLARWLHGFWSSYSVIPITSLEQLHYYSGTEEKRAGNFKKRINKALSALTEVGFIEKNWWISREGSLLAHRKPIEIGPSKLHNAFNISP
jgi:hypothetical protein